MAQHPCRLESDPTVVVEQTGTAGPTMKLREFVCGDCGGRVLSYINAVVDDRCATCCWIRENIPTEHQEDARERLGVPLLKGGSDGAILDE